VLRSKKRGSGRAKRERGETQSTKHTGLR